MSSPTAPSGSSGVRCGTDTMRLADRPFGDVPLVGSEKASDDTDLDYPGVHSFRAGRTAGIEAYRMAGITDPIEQLDFVEPARRVRIERRLQTYEDLGLCRYGEGYGFVGTARRSSSPWSTVPNAARGRSPRQPLRWPHRVRPPGGATGLMQAVFAAWQLQGAIRRKFGDSTLQIPHARRGAIHSHAGTGPSVTVSILGTPGF